MLKKVRHPEVFRSLRDGSLLKVLYVVKVAFSLLIGIKEGFYFIIFSTFCFLFLYPCMSVPSYTPLDLSHEATLLLGSWDSNNTKKRKK